MEQKNSNAREKWTEMCKHMSFKLQSYIIFLIFHPSVGNKRK